MGFNIENLNQDEFIKKYKLQEVTNPIPFNMKNIPTEDGLLSDKIFGITPKERSETFAFIRLNEKFLHPAIYDQLIRYSSKFVLAMSGSEKFIIKNGELIQDENGESGVKWVVDNFKHFVFKNTTNSSDKYLLSESLTKYQKKNQFMDKIIITPPFYRDVDTSKGFISIGKINELYTNIIRTAKAIKDSDMYMGLKENTMFKMQSLLHEIFNYFMDSKYSESGDTILGDGGAIDRTILRKTIKHSSRLVLSQADNDSNHWKDIEVDVDSSLVPLDSLAASLQPFILFNIKNLIHNRYKSGDLVKGLKKSDTKYKEVQVYIHDIETYYDDNNLIKYINRFIKSNTNRFEPVIIPTKEKNEVYFNFSYVRKGETIVRPLTWTDLIYIAANDAAIGKYCLSTRYPMDTVFNQLVTKVKVGSTIKTIPLTIRGTKYNNYPDISLNEVGSNTENKFKTTYNVSNVNIGTVGGDFDGDTMSIKVMFSNESNEELNKFVNSKSRSIDLSGKLIYSNGNETSLACYTLTKCYNKGLLTEPLF